MPGSQAKNPFTEDEKEHYELVQLNTVLAEHFSNKLGENGPKIRFDEPDPEERPTEETFHLFLYLIHEDLDVRRSSGRQYNPSSGTFAAEQAHVRCLYLVTYWDPKSQSSYDSPQAQADSNTVKNINKMIRALLALRKEPNFRSYQLRIIEPEALNSLGNFWQALNNKPRTIINFAITLPISLDYPEEEAPAVVKTVIDVEQLTAEALLILEQQLYTLLQQAASPGELARVTLHVALTAANIKQKKARRYQQPITIFLSGIAHENVVNALIEQAEGWMQDLPAEFAREWVVTDVNTNQLEKFPSNLNT